MNKAIDMTENDYRLLQAVEFGAADVLTAGNRKIPLLPIAAKV